MKKSFSKLTAYDECCAHKTNIKLTPVLILGKTSKTLPILRLGQGLEVSGGTVGWLLSGVLKFRLGQGLLVAVSMSGGTVGWIGVRLISGELVSQSIMGTSQSWS